jgi:hypothetical protein
MDIEAVYAHGDNLLIETTDGQWIPAFRSLDLPNGWAGGPLFHSRSDAEWWLDICADSSRAIEQDEQQSVGHYQFWRRGNAPAQHVLLMPQQDELSFKPRLRLERRKARQGEAGAGTRLSSVSLPDLTPHASGWSIR